jgi:hypothetical protein
VQGGYSVSVEEVRSSGGAEPSIRAIGAVRSTRGIVYRGFAVEAPKFCNENCDIAIRDIPIAQNRPSVEDACQEIPRSRGSENRGFQGKKLLHVGIAKRDIPTGELCGPQQEIVEDRWHSIGDRGKVSPESINIRIRDPAKSDIPIEVTGSRRDNSHVCRSFGISGIGSR